MSENVNNFRAFPASRASPPGSEPENASPAQDGNDDNAAAVPPSPSQSIAAAGSDASGEEEEMSVLVPAPAASTSDPDDERRGADSSAVGDLFSSDSTLLEDNPLLGAGGKGNPITIHHHEELLRMASRRTIAEIVEMFNQRRGEAIKNKKISVRLDAAKKKVAEARGIRRKDVVAAFEEKKLIYGVNKRKDMAAGKKRQAKKVAAGLKGKGKKRGAQQETDDSAEEDVEMEDSQPADRVMAEIARNGMLGAPALTQPAPTQPEDHDPSVNQAARALLMLSREGTQVKVEGEEESQEGEEDEMEEE